MESNYELVFETSSGTLMKRLSRVCSAMEYRGTDEYYQVPEVGTAAMLSLLKSIAKSSKEEVVPVKPESLLAIMRANSLRDVYKAIATIWGRMKKHRELLPVPFNDMLRYSGVPIVKQVKLEASEAGLNATMPTAKYNINLAKISQRRSTDDEARAQKINGVNVAKYVERRLQGMTIKRSAKGLVTVSAKEKKALADAKVKKVKKDSEFDNIEEDRRLAFARMLEIGESYNQ